MVARADPGRQAWRPWTVQLPAALAALACVLLGTIGWFAVGLQTAIGCDPIEGPAPAGCGGSGWPWATAGDLGQWVLAATVITVGIRSLSRPGSRRSAAIACWLAIPLAAGWFALSVWFWQR
jgi:hypothetical protein